LLKIICSYPFKGYLDDVKILFTLKTTKMKNNSKILVAIGAGVAIGGILGVLFAPDKGTETRKKLGDKGKELAEGVKDKFNKGKGKLNRLQEGIKERMEAVNDKVQEFV